MPQPHQKLAQREAAGIVVVLDIGTGRQIGIVAVEKYDISAPGGQLFIQIKVRRRKAGTGRFCDQTARRGFGKCLQNSAFHIRSVMRDIDGNGIAFFGKARFQIAEQRRKNVFRIR